MMMGHWNMWGWGGGFMMLAWILWLGIAIYFIAVYAGKANFPKGKDATNETALDILKKRYASGEISVEEFEKMKRDLQ